TLEGGECRFINETTDAFANRVARLAIGAPGGFVTGGTAFAGGLVLDAAGTPFTFGASDEMFFARYDPDGVFADANAITHGVSNGNAAVHALAPTADGGFVAGGFYRDDFSPDDTTAVALTQHITAQSEPANDAWVARFGPDGHAQWIAPGLVVGVG